MHVNNWQLCTMYFLHIDVVFRWILNLKYVLGHYFLTRKKKVIIPRGKVIICADGRVN